jgi:hypothetical protein
MSDGIEISFSFEIMAVIRPSRAGKAKATLGEPGKPQLWTRSECNTKPSRKIL